MQGQNSFDATSPDTDGLDARLRQPAPSPETY
jgi:hypothetical protein